MFIPYSLSGIVLSTASHPTPHARLSQGWEVEVCVISKSKNKNHLVIFSIIERKYVIYYWQKQPRIGEKGKCMTKEFSHGREKEKL
jgi:hypothetical protein